LLLGLAFVANWDSQHQRAEVSLYGKAVYQDLSD